MEATQSRWNWGTQRIALGVASLTAVAVLAGGAGGYLFRGTATVAVHQTTSAASRARCSSASFAFAVAIRCASSAASFSSCSLARLA